MKAIITTAYGSPDVLKLREVEKPTPKDNEVLIRLRASTVTAGDCEVRAFQVAGFVWLPLRLALGIFKPRKKILGSEIAGVIEAVGKDVTRFAVGDEVFGSTGFTFGAHAEYVSLPDSRPLATMPKNMSFEEAATIPIGAQNSLHFLRKANIQPGEKVLVYGASGSIGTYAVQLAKQFEAEVSVVTNPTSLELMRELGASTVFDYTKDDFSESGAAYDVIFDAIGKSPYSKSIRCLEAGGRYLQANPTFVMMLLGLWTSLTSNKKVIFEFADESTEDFVYLRGLIEAGELKSVIDRSYRLEEMVEAQRYVEKRTKTGHVVIQIGRDDQ